MATSSPSKSQQSNASLTFSRNGAKISSSAGVRAFALLARRGKRWRAAKTSLCLNLFTHPLANLAYVGKLGSFIAVEVAVVAVEAWLYAWIERPGARRAFVWSAAANGVTMALSWFF